MPYTNYAVLYYTVLASSWQCQQQMPSHYTSLAGSHHMVLAHMLTVSTSSCLMLHMSAPCSQHLSSSQHLNRVTHDLISGASTTSGSLPQQGIVSGVKEQASAPTGAQTPDQADEHFSMDKGSHR